MGDEKSQRLDDALSSLVDSLTPDLPYEDEATVDERREDALDLARSIIDRWAIRMGRHGLLLTLTASHGSPAVVSDVNHAADLIKKKRERRSPHLAPPQHREADIPKFCVITVPLIKPSNFRVYMRDSLPSQCSPRNGPFYTSCTNWQTLTPMALARVRTALSHSIQAGDQVVESLM